MLKLLSDNLKRDICVSRARVFSKGKGSAQSLASALIWAAQLKAEVVVTPVDGDDGVAGRPMEPVLGDASLACGHACGSPRGIRYVPAFLTLGPH